MLIDLSLGHPGASAFASGSPSLSWLLHPVSEAELLVGACNRFDLRRLEVRIAHLRRVRVESIDFDHCIAFVRRFGLSHGVGWPDCLIAATAIRLGVPLVTLNDKHFKVFKGLKVRRPY